MNKIPELWKKTNTQYECTLIPSPWRETSFSKRHGNTCHSFMCLNWLNAKRGKIKVCKNEEKRKYGKKFIDICSAKVRVSLPNNNFVSLHEVKTLYPRWMRNSAIDFIVFLFKYLRKMYFSYASSSSTPSAKPNMFDRELQHQHRKNDNWTRCFCHVFAVCRYCYSSDIKNEPFLSFSSFLSHSLSDNFRHQTHRSP